MSEVRDTEANYIVAQDAYDEVRNTIIDCDATIRRCTIALEFAGQDPTKIPPDRLEWANDICSEDLMAKARRKPDLVHVMREETEEVRRDAIEKFPEVEACFKAATKAEADRIAQGFVAEHRRAAADMAAAVRQLSRAIVAERQILARFAAAVPRWGAANLQVNPALPWLHAIIATGAIEERGSRAWALIETVKALG